MSRFVLGCLAVCGIAWFGFYVGAKKPTGSEVRQIGVSHSIPLPVEPSRQVIAPALVAPAVSSAAATSVEDNAPREVHPRRQAPVERTEEERRVYASGVFDSEPVDTGWARATQRELTGKLRELVGGSSSVQAVDCKNTLCRVELDNDNDKAGQDFLRSFMRSHAWAGNGMAIRGEPDSKGRVALTMYLAREGAALPEAEPE
jgi:hypothetical protein